MIAHNLKLLAISLEDAIKEDPDKYLQRKQTTSLVTVLMMTMMDTLTNENTNS